MKFEDVGKGFYCEMQSLGLPECPCVGRTSCVGCRTGRRRRLKEVNSLPKLSGVAKRWEGW